MPTRIVPRQAGSVDGIGVSDHPLWATLARDTKTYMQAVDMRTAIENRYRNSGFSVTDVGVMDAVKSTVGAARETLKLTYEHVVPEHIRQWGEQQRGVGAVSFARLLGEIGHPRTIYVYEKNKDGEWVFSGDIEERSVRQLYSYCGMGDPNRRMYKGITQEHLFALGNPDAKVALYLVAKHMKMWRNPEFRPIYEKYRDKYENKAHDRKCAPCSASPGDPWKKGHQDAAAQRVMAKAFLKELWKVST